MSPKKAPIIVAIGRFLIAARLSELDLTPVHSLANLISSIPSVTACKLAFAPSIPYSGIRGRSI